VPLVQMNSYERLGGSDFAEAPGQDVERGTGNLPTEGSLEFHWNGRACFGTELHVAVLNGDAGSASSILAKDSRTLDERFHYETMFKGTPQEGSGQAIHLAVSRGHLEVVKLLVDQGADLDAMVTRSHMPHYNVLHAAVFAEGRGASGGSKQIEVLEYLLSKRAPMSPNQNGKWPIHIAFQIGSLEMITLLTGAMQEQGLDHIFEQAEVPLAVGIKFGKLSEELLAQAAPLTPHSLKFFVDNEQRCLQSFIQRMMSSNWTPAELAKHITGVDISKVLRSSPEAASALLDGLTGVPECESIGWWPLPSRVSFAPRSRLECLRALVNPPAQVLSYYQTDSFWRYNLTQFEAPEWHDSLTDRSWGKPVVDASIKVCHVPNMVCAEFFSAVVEASDSGLIDDLNIYRNLVVQGSINVAWWHGACAADMAHVILTIVGLGVLVVETSLPVPSSDLKSVHPAPAASAFLGAKGAVDLTMEVVQFAGCIAIGRAYDYISVGNLVDLCLCAMQMFLLFSDPDGPKHRVVIVAVVFLYWARLGRVFNWAENISRALLPIQKLVHSLGPASIVTVVGFCAFTHAFYLAEGKQGVFWSYVVPECFSTLISAELPKDVAQKDALQALLTYGAVIVFSIFFMNVFIGVIGQQYEEKREACHLMFQQQRACACCNFLVRARVLPCSLAPQNWARVAGAAAILCMLALLGHGLIERAVQPWSICLFILLQMMVLVSAYQNPSAPWATLFRCSDRENAPHYLWTVVSRASESEETVTLAELKKMVIALQNSYGKQRLSSETSLAAESAV